MLSPTARPESRRICKLPASSIFCKRHFGAFRGRVDRRSVCLSSMTCLVRPDGDEVPRKEFFDAIDQMVGNTREKFTEMLLGIDPGPAMPPAMGRLGASACTILSQPMQASLGRTCRITLKCSGTRSRISETSSPRSFSLPPQSGQASCLGKIFRSSRSRCVGSDRRIGTAA
jgi:hypothetical protein